MRAAQWGKGARNRRIVRGKRRRRRRRYMFDRRSMDGAELTCAPASTTVLLPAAGGHHQAISRPTLGFPLGTALLLIVIFCLSGIFSCCYHWEKLHSLLRRGGRHNHHRRPSLPTVAAQYHQDSSLPLSPSKLTFKPQDSKQEMQLSLPVIMAGDRFPKFMALPCPSPLPITATTTATNDNATNDAAAATVVTLDVLVFPSPSLSAPSH